MLGSGRSSRAAIAVGVLISLAIASVPAHAASTWGPQRKVAARSWSARQTFAVSVGGPLVALTTTDFVGGHVATDNGPRMGVFAQTSDDRGVTWTAPVRVSQQNRQSDWAALAASGDALYATWVTQMSYDHYDPAQARILWFRANPGGGWGPTIQLTKKGRVDFPAVAASGSRVYVVWVDANTGQLRVARSANGGRSWQREIIGKTTALSIDGEGHYGYASVGASGNVVGVAWIASGSGAIKARVSTNGGKKWQSPVSLTGSLGFANRGTPSAAGWDGKIIVAWTTAGGVFTRTWARHWDPSARVATFGSSGAYKGGYDVDVAPQGGGHVGLAYAGCRTSPCSSTTATTLVEVLWSESSDGGASWSAPQLVQGSLHADQRINDGVTIAWVAADARAVGYTGYASGFTTYGTFLRVGS